MSLTTIAALNHAGLVRINIDESSGLVTFTLAARGHQLEADRDIEREQEHGVAVDPEDEQRLDRLLKWATH